MVLIAPVFAAVTLLIFLLIFGPLIVLAGVVIYLVRRNGRRSQPLQMSNDGRWYWDGREWRSAISEDGLWRWDGREWKPVSQSGESER